jgi:hypothetical protein
VGADTVATAEFAQGDLAGDVLALERLVVPGFVDDDRLRAVSASGFSSP